MHRKKFVTALAPFLAAAALWIAPLPQARAVPLVVNGDFADSTDLAGWTATGDIVGEPTGAFAQLETDGTPPTDGTYLRTLEQTFLLPAAPARLFFDFAFSTSILSGADVLTDIFFPDSFAVSLVTTDLVYFVDILVVDVYGAVPDPSDGIETDVGALPIAVGLDPRITIAGFAPFTDGFSTSGHVDLWLPAAIRDREVTLYFDLFEKPDGANTRAAIDNVAVAAMAVPAPATLSLVLLGLAAAGVARRRSAS
jgi:hypothetical protein